MLDRRLLLLGLPVLSFACFDVTNQPPGPDSGVTSPDSSGVDASQADTSTPDGALPDATPDAAPDTPPPPMPVVVAVVNETGAEAGITIVFQDAAGTVIATDVTGATGRVARVLPSGSQVTALLGTATSPLLLTVVGVEPGDVLTAIDAPSFGGAQASVTSIPASPPTGTTGYTAFAGQCSIGFTAPPATVDLTPPCVNGAAFPMLVLAEDVNGQTLGFTVGNGNMLAADGGVALVSLAGTWLTTVTNQTVTVTNAPAPGNGTIAFSEIANGVGHPFNVSLNGMGGTQSSSFSGHTGYPDAVQAEANVLSNNFTSMSAIATRSAPPTADATTAFDLSTLLPAITSATTDGTTPARPTATWMSAASLAASAGFLVVIPWSSPSVDGGPSVSGQWMIVLPPTATNAQAPALPMSAGSWIPASGSSFATPLMAAVAGTMFPGYAQFRGVAAGFPPPQNIGGTSTVVPPLAVNGTIRLSVFGPPGG